MSKQPDPWRELGNEIAALKAEVKDLRMRSPFFGTGMHPNGQDGVDSDNYVPDVSGYRLAETPEFNDLKLRGGIIGNDALTSPVVPDQAFAGAANFGVTVAGAAIVQINKATPAGFTRCVVTAFGRVVAINSTGGPDYLYSNCGIGAGGGNQFAVPVLAGGFNTTTAGYCTLLTGLTTGANVNAFIFASTGVANWAANPANGADLAVTYLWFR